MKRAYNYFQFRIYTYYRDKNNNDSENLLVFYTTSVMTLITLINFMWIYYLLILLDSFPDSSNKYYLLLSFCVVFVLHYLNIKSKKFLNVGFKKDVMGGWMVIGIFVLTGIITIIISNLYRNKI